MYRICEPVGQVSKSLERFAALPNSRYETYSFAAQNWLHKSVGFIAGADTGAWFLLFKLPQLPLDFLKPYTMLHAVDQLKDGAMCTIQAGSYWWLLELLHCTQLNVEDTFLTS